jgi:hypothetical protein
MTPTPNAHGKVKSYLIRARCLTQVLSLPLIDGIRSSPALKDSVFKKKKKEEEKKKKKKITTTIYSLGGH